MFPFMDRDGVFTAQKKFHEILVEKPGKRGKALLFAINRFDKKLDRLGTGYGKYYTKLSFTDVLNFCSYNIYHHDMFVFCNRMMRQKRGLAIGATANARLASITLPIAEELHYPCITPVPLDKAGHHPSDLPVHPATFRDNIIGLKRIATPLSAIQANLECMYALDLQIEGEGRSLKTLEGLLSLEEHNVQPYIRISGPPGIDTTALIERAKLRYPPMHAAVTRKIVRSLVRAEVKKDLFYRENPHDAKENTLHTVASIHSEGYPKCWWEPLVWDQVPKYGGPLEALRAALSPVAAPECNDNPSMRDTVLNCPDQTPGPR